MDLGCAEEPAPEFAGPGVIAPAVLLGRHAVERVAKQLVAEVEVADVHDAELEQEPVIHELPERRIELLDGTVPPAGRPGGSEAPPGARAGWGARLCVGRATSRACSDRVIDGV